jgi:hypothetical protein
MEIIFIMPINPGIFVANDVVLSLATPPDPNRLYMGIINPQVRMMIKRFYPYGVVSIAKFEVFRKN